ncbi:hypothetical protein ACFXHA_45155 [Nocardia sp. NPDC059240]|uniref:hypothetical protein n=1 Tax=Nocardia sp. NPDC059240 TaxID=3346786 RepID=UPI003675F29D
MAQWLPLFSSLVIASVTLLGIRIANRTNRAAISAADGREHLKWQREQILKLCGESVECAYNGQIAYGRMIYNPEDSERLAGALSILERGGSIEANAGMLQMLNAPSVSAACRELADAFNDDDLIAAVREIVEADEGEDPLQSQMPGALTKVENAFEAIEKARDNLIEAAAAELASLGQPGVLNSTPGRFLRGRRIAG